MAKYFQELREFLTEFKRLSINEIAYEVAKQQSFQREVIRINTELQLFKKGEDSTGTKLSSIGGGYSPVTIEIKRSKGQPIDRVTLKDTGDFYQSFQVIPYMGGFRIETDVIKDDTNLETEWGEDIIGIQEGNKILLVEKYVEAIIKEVEKLRESL